MANSSYDKVAALICQTEDWKFYETQVRRRLESIRLVYAQFEVRNLNDIRPRFSYKHEYALRSEDVWRGGREEYRNFQVDWDHVAPFTEILEIAQRVWDSKKVATYNCKYEKVKKAKDRNCVKETFPELARQHLKESLSIEYSTATNRVILGIRDFYEGPGFEERRSQAIERKAVEEIKEVLMKYRSLDVSIVKSAIQEFVCEDVLSS